MKINFFIFSTLFLLFILINGCVQEKETINSPSHYYLEEKWNGGYSTRAWNGKITSEVNDNKIIEINILISWSHIGGINKVCSSKYVGSKTICWKGYCNKSINYDPNVIKIENKEWGCNKTYSDSEPLFDDIKTYERIFILAKEAVSESNNEEHKEKMTNLNDNCLESENYEICFENGYLIYFHDKNYNKDYTTRIWNITILN